ncbi:PAAR domain-containing protein [Providencia alcalifaciens]|uniref:PAAR domain-containing protein n=1 Tax=Providencia alcalifaciens TaxID=126385 RepID=UPI002AA0DBE5|nr:PAAR domain-containing protein [Providencia alcalifaciens]
MAVGYFLRVGDSTTCGGHILTGDNTFQWYGVAGAREGDLVTCGKHSGAYYIIGGVNNVWMENRKHAGSIESMSTCPCRARFIPSINDCYITEESTENTNVIKETARHEEINQDHHARYLCTDDFGNPLSNYKYHIYFDNEKISGVTDSDGHTQWHRSISNKTIYIHIERNS